MKLFLKSRVDRRQTNLSTTKKVAIIILYKYTLNWFCDIILVYGHLKNNDNQYYNIGYNWTSYIPLHYILFFPWGNSKWYWVLTLQDFNRWQKMYIMYNVFFIIFMFLIYFYFYHLIVNNCYNNIFLMHFLIKKFITESNFIKKISLRISQ